MQQQMQPQQMMLPQHQQLTPQQLPQQSFQNQQPQQQQHDQQQQQQTHLQQLPNMPLQQMHPQLQAHLFGSPGSNSGSQPPSMGGGSVASSERWPEDDDEDFSTEEADATLRQQLTPLSQRTPSSKGQQQRAKKPSRLPRQSSEGKESREVPARQTPAKELRESPLPADDLALLAPMKPPVPPSRLVQPLPVGLQDGSQPAGRSLEELLEQVPYNDEGERTSLGSLQHPETCSPCLFWFKGKCGKGIHCDYCHFRHPGQKNKRIRPSKNTRQQMRTVPSTQKDDDPEDEVS